MANVDHAMIEWNGADKPALVSLWIGGVRTLSTIDGGLFAAEIAKAAGLATAAEQARTKTAADLAVSEAQHAEINRLSEVQILADRAATAVKLG